MGPSAGTESAGSSTPSEDLSSERTGYRPRRTHQKSRLGCLMCKKRRIKCDEAKPECQRCQLHGAICVYKPIQDVHLGRNKALASLFQSQRPTGQGFSMALTSTAENIESVLYPTSQAVPTNVRASVRHENLEAINRFELFTSHTLGAPTARHIIRTHGIRLAFTAPHLMHCLLAATTDHLQRLVPSYKPNVQPEYHWNRAISLFKTELSRPIDAGNMDAMISTCMMLSVHAFTSDDDNASQSWLLSDSPNWLYIQGGLPGIVEQCTEYADNSIWIPFFRTIEARYDNAEAPHIPPAFTELCDLYQTPDPQDNNPYYHPLRLLFYLMRLEPTGENFGDLVLFVGRVAADYRLLLRQRESRALLILAYWFALMVRVDQWWLQNRVRSECRAICKYLEHHDDPRIVELLEFPALVCGYDLSSISLPLRPVGSVDAEN